MKLICCSRLSMLFLFTFSVLSNLQVISQDFDFYDSEWPAYGRDNTSSKYSPLDQINSENVSQLQVAWKWTSVDQPILVKEDGLWTWTNECTPIMKDGVLYTSTSLSQVAAIEAETGDTIWSYDPKSYVEGSPPNHGFVHRGVAYYEHGEDQRIFIGTGDAYLIAINAKTGKPIPEFGDNGRIDLTKGLRREINRLLYGVSSPPIICRDTVIVGSSISDFPRDKEMPPGDVRGFDANTGELRWIFESIPQNDAEGVETWENESWKNTGNTNVWTMMSADDELGYVYLPFGTPSNDYYGGNRHGDNLYAESLVAVDAITGKKVWHYQMVHHGLWDYDLPAAPILMDIEVDGKEIKAVAQLTKHGFCFVFDRVTGKPVWDIEERPVPPSNVPGEKTSPTQPFPTKPLPFDRQGLTENDLIDFTPELRKDALDFVNQYEYGPLFTPPSLKGTIFFPGIAGGASWVGGAYHPEKKKLYIPSITLPFLIMIVKPEDSILENRRLSNEEIAFNRYITLPPQHLAIPVNQLPLTKPPYGRITAINMNTGEHSWMVPMGKGPLNNPNIIHLNLPNLGWPFRTQVLATKSLLFAAQDGYYSKRELNMNDVPGFNLKSNSVNIDPSLRAIDLDSGEILEEIEISGNATGTMMTYMLKGKQYIVIPVGGASQPAELIALSLP